MSKLDKEELTPLIISRSDGGGAGIAARRIHQALRKNGIKSTMLVMAKISDDPSILQVPATYAGLTDCSYSDDYIAYHQILQDSQRWQLLRRKYKNRKSDIGFFSDIFSNIDLYNIKEVKDADIINIHWIAGIVNYSDLPFSLSGKPVFWTLHDMNPFTGGCHYNNGCEKYLKSCGKCPQLGSNREEDITRIFFAAKTKALKNLDLNIITPSRWLGRCSQTSLMLGKFPHHVIPNCIPTEIFKPKKRDIIRLHYNLNENDFVILGGAVALNDERKGFSYIVKALEVLTKTAPSRKITLALYGKLEDDPILPQGIKLLKLGYIHNIEKMVDSYNLADIFMIPSLEDNLPNTVLEALACGTPVIGFRTGGIPDMIIHKKTCYLVKQKEIDGLVKGIEWAMALKERMSSTRTFCRDSVLENFSEKVIAEQYSRLFEQALKQKRTAQTLLNNATPFQKQTKEFFEQARKFYPFASEILREEALFLNNNKEHDKAVALLSEALDLNPG
ncbi:glycosyltransferase, partial [bacterium]|nr:glycosyltransferase [bacterium]